MGYGWDEGKEEVNSEGRCSIWKQNASATWGFSFLPGSLACLLVGYQDSRTPPVASSTSCCPAILGRKDSSLTGRVLGVLLCALFWWLWVGVWVWFGFSFFLFNGSAWDIFYKVLHFAPGPCWTQPGIKQNVCGPVPVCHCTLGAFLKVAFCGPREYWNTHRKMQASELASCVFLKSSSQEVAYCVIPFI